MQSANKMCVALLFGGMSSEHEVSCVSVGNFVRNIDRSKFIDGVEPLQVLNMLIWMTDGYLHMQRYSGNSQDLDAMMEEFSRCAQLLKKAVYKEAYQ